MKTEVGQTEINKTLWINCLVGKLSFAVLNGFHHESSIKCFQRLLMV